MASTKRKKNLKEVPPFPIVGIGASAGGLEAVTELLKALPPKPGIAFVLVQHLDPTHQSAMAELLARHTKMEVLEVKDNTPVKANHLYIIPPNRLMELEKRKLRLKPRSEDNVPIDYFFRSVAATEGNRSIAVILSGSSGSDASHGVMAIKNAGGITFAQDEKSAKYATMPLAAISTGSIDFVLPPAKIAAELARLAGHPYIATEELAPPKPTEEKAMEDILESLRRQVHVDFRQYKPATLRRRIMRRMALQKLESVKEYAEYLRKHPPEVRELFTDLLIHVTGFFRDPEIFRLLKRKVFPRLLKNRTGEDPIRIWVPGCSSGEEVYSLAITLLEVMAEHRVKYQIQIFGTDINEPALAKARAGVYPESIREDVPLDVLRSYFHKSEQGFRINKVVREMCIFARQNVAVDPPFSNLDLVSCRNLLIYLGAPLQRKVISLFHYSLKNKGMLLLGASETIGSYADLFSLTDNKAKLYSKKATRTRTAMNFGRVPIELRDENRPPQVVQPEPGPSMLDIQRHADQLVLARHSPPGVIINRNFEVLQFRGQTGPFLEHSHGEATLNLLKMVREGLLGGVRAAVSRSMKQNTNMREDAVQVRQNGGYLRVAIEVVPFQVPLGRDRLYLVLFHPEAAPSAKAKGRKAEEGSRPTPENAEIKRLRQDLAGTRESLQVTVEEMEATNEELRSANEEIMSSNEELQSTNEELETAKEELQSTNEELATLNDELENRNGELEHVNNDLYNLLSSVNIPIVIVGRDLHIRRFTGIAEKMLNLIPSDVGRPITDINLKIPMPGLKDLLVEVIDTLQTREQELRDATGRWWSLRVRPYQTIDQKIDGAVIALFDIHLIKTGMEQAARELSEGIADLVDAPLAVLDRDLKIQVANEGFHRVFQTKPEESLGRSLYDLAGGRWGSKGMRAMLETELPKMQKVEKFEAEFQFPKGVIKKLSLSAKALLSDGDQRRLVLLSVDDSPKRKER